MSHSLALSSFQAQLNNPTVQRGAFRSLFNKAASRAKWRRFLARLNGRSTHLQSVKTTHKNGNRLLSGIQQIAIDNIIGSEGRCQDFDNQFLPLQTHSRERWVSIAVARHNRYALPPVELIHTDAGYFVRDGHHRISVARAFGQATIEAVVV